MGLEKIAAGVGKAAKATGKFFYEAGKGVIKGVGKAVYEVGKGVYRGVKSASGSPTMEPMDSALDYGDSLNFFDELKIADIPKRNYNDLSSLVSGTSQVNLSDAERIDRSLNLLDKMYAENYINKRTHKKLKKSLYFEFKRSLNQKNYFTKKYFLGNSIEKYLPLASSILFLFFGILLLKPNLTGFVSLGNFTNLGVSFIGVIYFLLGISFLGVFLREIEKS